MMAMCRTVAIALLSDEINTSNTTISCPLRSIDSTTRPCTNSGAPSPGVA
jgi:hypothetical protein